MQQISKTYHHYKKVRLRHAKLIYTLLIILIIFITLIYNKIANENYNSFDNLYKTKTIEVFCTDTPTFKEKNKGQRNSKKMISILSRTERIEGFVPLTGTCVRMNLYDYKDNLLYSIMLHNDARIDIETRDYKVLDKDIK